MSKEALSAHNIDQGRFLAHLNDAIGRAYRELVASENPNGKATVTAKLTLEFSDTEGYFVAVTPDVQVKAPARAKKPVVYGVQNLDGERQIVVDSEQDGAQMKLSGVANLDAKRAAS